MSTVTPPPLSFTDLQEACTGTFRKRFYTCMKILGIQEVRFLASVGIDPAVLSKRTANQPFVPLIHVRGWHQPFIRDMVVTPPLPPSSKILEPQDLRDALVDPGSALPVREACGEKAVFDIVWSYAARPDVTVTGRTFDSTPVSGFTSGGSEFSVVIPDHTTTVAGQATADINFEFAYRLARHHFRADLPDACHNFAVMESFGTLMDDVFLKRYFSER